MIHEVIIIADGLLDEKHKSDVIAILGNKVNIDGTLSLRLKARLDKGLELYNDSLAPIVFVSGGLGKEGFYEGSRMASYLMSKGIDSLSIVIDNEGNTTQLTANNFRNYFPLNQKVIVVSQFYHISRTKLAFNNVGLNEVYGVHCNYFEFRDCYSLFREFFGYYSYLLKG